MDNLIIGDDPLKICQLVRLIEKSSSYPLLLQSWRRFGRGLEVNDAKLLDLERKLLNETIQIKDVPFDILATWKAQKGSDATLGVFRNALVLCGINDISELLEKEFWLVAVKLLKIKFHNKVINLEQILTGSVSEETYKCIYNELKKCPHSQIIELLKEEAIPKAEPNYYVPRTLSSMTQVDEKIFRPGSIKNNLLLVKGIRKHELARMTGFQPVDVSGNQFDEITVSYIVLEQDEDFHRICKKTTKPVHLVEHQNGSFFWTKSNGNMRLIQEFIQKSKDNLREEELIAKVLSTPPPTAISISDSPGMGKSFLLNNLAMKAKSTSNSIVMILVLEEFVKRMKCINSTASTISEIANYACRNQVAKIIFEELLMNTKHHLDLFLDAYDEVSQEMLHITDSFLTEMKELKNVRVFVTTRPHLRPRLENVLSVISYEILPFNDSNQTRFLSDFWIGEHGAKPGERLENYAKKCLKTLHEEMTDKEEDIAGIPLQCKMLANVFGEDAERASKSKTDAESTSTIRITCLFELYKKLVDFKLGLRGSTKTNYINAHVHDSIALLFPDWVERFKPLLKGFKQIEESRLYSIGLVEKSPYKNMPRFVHRTFAEYLLAEYLVKNLSKLRECPELVFGVILGDVDKKDRQSVYDKEPEPYKLNHPVIAHFINMHLKDQNKSNPLNELALSISKLQIKFQFEPLCKVVAACGSHGFEMCFDVAGRLLLAIPKQEDVIIRDTYFKFLPHFAIQNSKSVTFIKNVLGLIKNLFGVNLSYHVYKTDDLDRNSYPWIPGSTPLHMAVCLGRYNIVTCLVQEYGDQIASMRYLLHMCVHRSCENTEPMIDERLSIIELLFIESEKHNLNWLNERLDDRTPLLEEYVHLRLLERLVEVGVDINACSKHGTVLHTPYIADNYKDVVDWVLSQGFSVLNNSNHKGASVLINFASCVEEHFPKTGETLELLYNAGADFNAVDKDGNSVLFHAMDNRELALEAISKIIDFGANGNHKNNKNCNAAHILMQGRSQDVSPSLIESRELVNKLNLLIFRGFNLLNEANSEGFKAFHIVLANVEYFDDPELFDLFHLNGVDFNLKYQISRDHKFNFIRGHPLQILFESGFPVI